MVGKEPIKESIWGYTPPGEAIYFTPAEPIVAEKNDIIKKTSLNEPLILVCPICEEVFKPKLRNQKVCNNECYQEAEKIAKEENENLDDILNLNDNEYWETMKGN